MPLRDLWRRPPAPSSTLSAALADLDRLMAERPELAGPGRTLARVLRAAFAPEPGDQPIDPDAEGLERSRVLQGWTEGLPAGRVASPPLEPRSLTARGLALCDALRPDNPSAIALRAAFRDDPARLSSWARWTLSGQGESFAHDLHRLGLDPAAAASVLRLALLPALARWSARLLPWLPEGGWDRGACPICGDPPLLAESRGLEQRRALRCGRCAADWPGARLRCPSCGATDHRLFSYRFIEGEQDRYRLAHCDGCGLHLKVVATLAPLSAPGLLVTELAMVHLDLIFPSAP